MVLDGFTGIGGNAIQFARMGHQVVAVDIDPDKIEYARHNPRIYGVEHRMKFVVGDFFKVAHHLHGLGVHIDAVFLSPPWGGPEYSRLDTYDLSMLEPEDGVTLFQVRWGRRRRVKRFQHSALWRPRLIVFGASV